MKICRKTIAILATLTALHSFADPQEEQPMRFLCIGDSITQGGRNDRPEHTYRLPLQRMLHEAGRKYEFIGSQTKGLHGDTVWPEVAPGVPFDPHHEGYYGNRTAAVVDKVIAAWQDDQPAPDVVLVHLGTNDQGNLPHEETVQAPLKKLIEFLRGKNPRVKILLGHLNFNDSKGGNSIRPLVEALAAEMTTAESPVVTVHHYKGWHEKPDHPETDTFDWAHPNPQGQAKMAAAWLKALQDLPEK